MRLVFDYIERTVEVLCSWMLGANLAQKKKRISRQRSIPDVA